MRKKTIEKRKAYIIVGVVVCDVGVVRCCQSCTVNEKKDNRKKKGKHTLSGARKEPRST